jgi:hypothetical protein
VEVVYVGDPDDEKKDQQLDSVLIGPIKKGVSNIRLKTETAPDPAKIQPTKLLGV